MTGLCRIVLVIFAALYLFALAVFLIGTFGFFGSEPDPLSGVYLVPLGLPWNRMIDGASDKLLVWLAAIAPLVNVMVLWIVCRFIARRNT